MNRRNQRARCSRGFLIALTLLFAVLLAGCGSPSRVILDVRTPAEFASGHLEGAQNIDVESSDFATDVGHIDRAAEVFVYCRSGNRSAHAVEQLQRMGFSNVHDLGAMTDAADTLNLSVVP